MTRWTHLPILTGCLLLSIPEARSQTFKTRVELSDRNRSTTVVDAAVGRDGSVFVSTNEDTFTPAGLLRTNNAGKTWTSLRVSPTPQGTLIADPVDPMTLYSCGSTLQRTTTGGELWYTVFPQSCNAFAIDSGNRRILFLGTPTGIYRSADFGDKWSPVFLPQLFPLFLTTDPSGFGLAAFSTNDSNKLWLSRNHGASFDAIDAPGKIQTLSFHPFRPGVFYANVSGSVYLRDESGVWFLRNGTDTTLPRAYTLLADPLNPGWVWAATIGGLYRSFDEGRSWTRVLSGDYYSIKACGSVYVNSAIGGITWETHDGGGTWKEFSRVSTLDFGAGCSGYASTFASLRSEPLFRKYSSLNELQWAHSQTLTHRIRPLSQGRVAVHNGNGIQFFASDGKLEAKFLAVGGSPDFQIADDESVAIPRFEIPPVGSGVWMYDPTGSLQFMQRGQLLAIRPIDRAVVVLDGVFGFLARTATATEILSHLPPSTIALRYLPNQDYLVAGFRSDFLTLWISRYAADDKTPRWTTDIPLASAGSIHLSLDDAENVYAEIGREGLTSFLSLDRNGSLQWLQRWPYRRFLLVEPGGALSVISTEGGGARIEAVDLKGTP